MVGKKKWQKPRGKNSEGLPEDELIEVRYLREYVGVREMSFCSNEFAKEIVEVNCGFSKCEHSESESLLNSSFD